jgi:GNAT superfamily N-acetyltransferase
LGLAESLKIRNVSRLEMDILIDWAAAEGWNPGLFDAGCFYAADPRGFFVAELAGGPVGCISAVAYGAEFGFIGFYIVRPEYRGQGFGMKLWQTAMKYLTPRIIGLDGVVAQQNNYKQSGFQLAYRNIRYVAKNLQQTRLVSSDLPLASLVPLEEIPFAQLAEYDKSVFTYGRDAFLQEWIRQPQASAMGICRGSRLTGYGVVRACREGFKLGPLFADEPAGAETLFAALTVGRQGGPVFLDAPEVNPHALMLAINHGMVPVFETARMYTGGPPDIPLEKVYGVTSFELG